MRIAFLVSGNGSTFQYLVECARNENLPCTAALMISSNPKAYALERAESLKVKSVVIRRKDFTSMDEHAGALLDVLALNHCEFICLCGYLEMVPPQVVQAYRHRIVNIHPALLPSFGGAGMYGKRVHEAAIAYGARITGATVHFVDEEYDQGPILAQQAVRIDPTDTPDTLAVRVQAAEKNLYLGALRLLVHGRIQVDGRIVTILP